MTRDTLPRPFIGIYYVDCNSYGRIYKNKKQNAYTGICPKCMRSLQVKIKQGGSNARSFKAYCY